MDKSPASLPGWLVVITCLLLALAVKMSAGHADAPQDLAKPPQHSPPALSPKPRHNLLSTSGSLSRLDFPGENPLS